jgi:Fic family protein
MNSAISIRLIKMALIHHQFESIHPFPDGNGRIGRILNVLYLTRTGLLDIPVLYLSRFITRNKADYYRHLQAVRDTGDWEPWVIYMLEAVAETSATTVEIVTGIRQQMADVKHRLREDLPKIYSQELLNNLFRHPYTRIEYLQNDLDVSRHLVAVDFIGGDGAEGSIPCLEDDDRDHERGGEGGGEGVSIFAGHLFGSCLGGGGPSPARQDPAGPKTG